MAPFAMNTGWVPSGTLRLFSTYFTPGRIFPAIRSAGDFPSFCRDRPGDEMDDRFVIPQRLTAPIGGDEGKQPVFDLVPFAGAWRQMANRNGDARFIGEILQFALP